MNSKPPKTSIFQQADKKADEIVQQARILMPKGAEEQTILKVSIGNAKSMRDAVPKHIQNKINPEWELYDIAFDILNIRFAKANKSI